VGAADNVVQWCGSGSIGVACWNADRTINTSTTQTQIKELTGNAYIGDLTIAAIGTYDDWESLTGNGLESTSVNLDAILSAADHALYIPYPSAEWKTNFGLDPTTLPSVRAWVGAI
jgi:hypothetical protein